MAQTGFTVIQTYYSTTTTNVPLAANLAPGELAFNVPDKKLFANNGGVVTELLPSATNLVPVAFGGTGAGTAAGARTNLGATTAGANFFTLPNPSAIRFVRIDAGNTVTAVDAATYRTDIGATTVGGNLFTLANPAAITFPRINADNTVSALSAAATVTALGGTTVGANVFTLPNPSAITFPRFNADNTVSALDAASFRTAIGIPLSPAPYTRICNSAFRFNSRNYTSVSPVALTAGAFSRVADNWQFSTTGANGSGYVASNGVVLLGAQNGAGVINGATGMTRAAFRTFSEARDTYDLGGQAVVFSAYVFQNSGSAQTAELIVSRCNSSDNWSAVTSEFSTTGIALPNNTWTRVSVTGTLSTSAVTGLQLEVAVSGSIPASTLAACTLAQIELGSTAGAFQYMPYAVEDRWIKRYLPSFPVASGYAFPVGFATTTSNAILSLPFDAPARAQVTGILAANGTTLNTLFNLTNAGGGAAGTTNSVALRAGGISAAALDVTLATTTLNASAPTFPTGANSGALLFTGAELG